MKTAALALCLIIAGCALPAGAQVAGYKDVPKSHWAAGSVAHLVEAGILQKAPTKPSHKTAASPKFDGDKPVTRYEMAVTLYRFVQYIEHANSQGKTKFGADTLDGPTALKRLIADGYLPATTPLAKDSTKTVTANQFADALAQVIAHSREKSTPLSPDLKGAPIEKPESAAKG